MHITTRCQNCRSKDFLGIECAWPANYCIGAPQPRRPRGLRWTVGVLTVVLSVALATGVWQLMS